MTTPGTERWQIDLRRPVRSSPTVLDGTVYVGSDDRRLRAVDADAGEKRWAFKTDNYVRSLPTTADGTVYAGSTDRTVYAVDADAGEERWSFETGGPVKSSPTVVGGTVFVGSNDGNLYALDRTGIEQWHHGTEAPFQRHSPVVVDGTAYVRDGGLCAVDADDGTVQWRNRLPDTGLSSPTVAGGTIALGRSSFYTFDTTGDQNWRVDPIGKVRSAATATDGTLFVGTDRGYLYALDADTGDERWRHDTDGAVRSSPTVAGETVYVGVDGSDADETGAGVLHAVDATAGEERWSFTTDGALRSSPTVADGTVYVGSDHGSLYAIEADDGGSSRDSRVLLGTLGHHHTRVATDPATARFERGCTADSAPTEVYAANDPDGPGDRLTVVYESGPDDAAGATDRSSSPAGRDRFCPDCGTPLASDAAYCPGCGTELHRCPKCGLPCGSSTSYCPTCGTGLPGGA